MIDTLEISLNKEDINGHFQLVKWMKMIGFKNQKYIEKFEIWDERNKENRRARESLICYFISGRWIFRGFPHLNSTGSLTLHRPQGLLEQSYEPFAKYLRALQAAMDRLSLLSRFWSAKISTYIVHLKTLRLIKLINHFLPLVSLLLSFTLTIPISSRCFTCFVRAN